MFKLLKWVLALGVLILFIALLDVRWVASERKVEIQLRDIPAWTRVSSLASELDELATRFRRWVANDFGMQEEEQARPEGPASRGDEGRSGQSR